MFKVYCGHRCRLHFSRQCNGPANCIYKIIFANLNDGHVLFQILQFYYWQFKNTSFYCKSLRCPDNVTTQIHRVSVSFNKQRKQFRLTSNLDDVFSHWLLCNLHKKNDIIFSFLSRSNACINQYTELCTGYVRRFEIGLCKCYLWIISAIFHKQFSMIW